METLITQKFTFATITPYKDYSKLSDKKSSLNTFELNEVDVYDPNIEDYIRGVFTKDITGRTYSLPDKLSFHKRKLNFFYDNTFSDCQLKKTASCDELLRYLPFLKEGGHLVTDSNPFVNIVNYPEMDALYAEIKSQPNSILIDAKRIAKDLGNARATNIVLLGAAASLLPLSDESLKKAIKTLFERKGERIVNKNLEAFEKGKEIAAEIVS